MRKSKLSEAFIRFGVRQIVGNVCEPRSLGLQTLNQRHRLVHGLVHRVWLIAQGIENEDIEILEQRKRRFWQRAEVG
jgi:hypothetical protein